MSLTFYVTIEIILTKLWRHCSSHLMKVHVIMLFTTRNLLTPYTTTQPTFSPPLSKKHHIIFNNLNRSLPKIQQFNNIIPSRFRKVTLFYREAEDGGDVGERGRRKYCCNFLLAETPIGCQFRRQRFPFSNQTEEKLTSERDLISSMYILTRLLLLCRNKISQRFPSLPVVTFTPSISLLYWQDRNSLQGSYIMHCK